MTKEQAQTKRDRLAAEHPDATWIVSETGDGWGVVKLGLRPAGGPSGMTTAAKPSPERPDSPPAPDSQQVNPNWGF